MTGESTRWLPPFRSVALRTYDFRDDDRQTDEAGGVLAESAIWITWESQRRTTELSRALGIRLFQLLYDGPRILRYLLLALHTLGVIRREKPSLVIVQNPSIALALLAVIVRRLGGIPLVVDRHTNFAIGAPPSVTVRMFRKVSDFTLRGADLTIVTNDFLKRYLEEKGGRGFVLPDRLPESPDGAGSDLGPGRHVCLICTYAGDEPYEEFIAAARELPRDVRLYLTGSRKRGNLGEESRAVLEEFDTVIQTDFLPEEDYWKLLRSVDVIVDLTTLDHCLVCGAYEAIALGKPVILSDSEANRSLFGAAAVLVGSDTESIAGGVREVLGDLEGHTARVRRLAEDYDRDWTRRFDELRDGMKDLANRRGRN